MKIATGNMIIEDSKVAQRTSKNQTEQIRFNNDNSLSRRIVALRDAEFSMWFSYGSLAADIDYDAFVGIMTDSGFVMVNG